MKSSPKYRTTLLLLGGMAMGCNVDLTRLLSTSGDSASEDATAEDQNFHIPADSSSETDLDSTDEGLDASDSEAPTDGSDGDTDPGSDSSSSDGSEGTDVDASVDEVDPMDPTIPEVPPVPGIVLPIVPGVPDPSEP